MRMNAGNIALSILVAIYLFGYVLSVDKGFRTWGATHWYSYPVIAVMCLLWPVGATVYVVNGSMTGTAPPRT